MDLESAHAKTTHKWIMLMYRMDAHTLISRGEKDSDQCRPHTYVQYLQSLTPAAFSTTLCQQFTAVKSTSVFIYPYPPKVDDGVLQNSTTCRVVTLA